MAVITLAETKLHLGITNGQQDIELGGFINAAEKLVVERCGPLSVVDVVEDHRRPGPEILLLQWPVVSVTTVTMFPSGTVVAEQNFATDSPGYLLDLDAAALAYGFGTANVRVAYKAGRAALTPDLRIGVLDLIAHLWRASQNRVGVGQRAVFGSPGQDPDKAAPMPAGFAMPHRVRELLEGEMRPPVIA